MKTKLLNLAASTFSLSHESEGIIWSVTDGYNVFVPDENSIIAKD